MRVRRHFLFSGEVQGVGFRYTALRLANALNLTGWVRNLFDGRVEMEAQGEEADLDELLARLGRQRYIRIEHVEARNMDLIQEWRFVTRGY